MEYLRLKFQSIDFEDKLFRTVAVDPELNLYQLSIYIQILIKSKFCHMSYYKSDKSEYMDKIWIGEYNVPEIKEYNYIYFSIGETLKKEKNLIFEYDSGEGYTFNIFFEGYINLPFKRKVILLEGNGDGIFEDDKSGLRDFLDHKLLLDEICPWNIKIKNFDKYEYFKKLNVEQINESLEKEYKKTVQLLKSNDAYSDFE